jgi:hypothetical protein
MGVAVEGSSTSLGLCGVTNLDSSIMGSTTISERWLGASTIPCGSMFDKGTFPLLVAWLSPITSVSGIRPNRLFLVLALWQEFKGIGGE